MSTLGLERPAQYVVAAVAQVFVLQLVAQDLLGESGFIALHGRGRGRLLRGHGVCLQIRFLVAQSTENHLLDFYPFILLTLSAAPPPVWMPASTFCLHVKHAAHYQNKKVRMSHTKDSSTLAASV